MSKQDYQTPHIFINAVERKFEPIIWDLAAHSENKIVPHYYGPGSAYCDDTFFTLWPKNGLCWLNPEYENIFPYVDKCCVQSKHYDVKIALLVPVATGTKWFEEKVHNKCMVYFLRPRITFVGMEDPFPKDCMLCMYGNLYGVGYDIWHWI
jgi:phage N-6-adenine-methyltransferase